MYESLQKTSRPAPDDPLLVFGVDDDDHLLRDGAFIRKICRSSSCVDVQVFSGLQGKICKIWGHLAKLAYETHGADFTCLLGDDVVIKTERWQQEIEKRFATIARDHKLPFGAACVAFMDESFPGFPTFPVIHKWHFEAFGGSILPSQFDNQGGDPFLFELYKRFGSAVFALDCSLANTIGGKDSARYTKQRLRFEGDILSSALQVVQEAIGASRVSAHNSLLNSLIPATLMCLDVVVPTYRCDLEALQRITRLRETWPTQVSFWLVLDNPTNENAQAVRDMQSVAQNYQVNVLEQVNAKGMPQNYGASAARNIEIAHSKADNVVLLDDDVLPDDERLDAYLGAIMRWPNASVYVGSTRLPMPHNLLTHAIVASDIPGAYTIAERVRNPPWGVTANICVKARQVD